MATIILTEEKLQEGGKVHSADTKMIERERKIDRVPVTGELITIHTGSQTIYYEVIQIVWTDRKRDKIFGKGADAVVRCIHKESTDRI